jgi:Raf kinase inhibitor-like YbhB/YbcL family protein
MPMLPSNTLTSRHQAGLLLLALGCFVPLGCSSEEGSPSTTGGSAGNSPGGSTAAGGSGTAGSSAGTTGGGAAGSAGGSVGGQGGSGGSTSGGGGSGGNAGGMAGGGTGGTGGSGGVAPFALTSSAFQEGEEVPLMYKCEDNNPAGDNISPPLSWGPGPAGTMSYAVVLHHVPTPEHWVIWDIPANVTSLPENIDHVAEPTMPAGSKQSHLNGLDGFTGYGYLGPCPQATNSEQSYVFTLYALDVATVPNITPDSDPTQAANEVKNHLVAGSEGVTLSGTQIRLP